MQPMFIFAFVVTPIVLIITVIVHVAAELKIPFIVSLWLGINMLISVFAIITVFNRKFFSTGWCFNKFASFFSRVDYSVLSKGFWQEAGLHYACTIDKRLMNPSSYVYVILTVYPIVYMGVLISLCFKIKNEEFKKLLLVHGACAVVYVSTLICSSLK